MTSRFRHLPEDRESEEDGQRRFFVKHIWCHGQSAGPPIIGVVFLYHLLRRQERDEDNKISTGMMFVNALMVLWLFLWPFLSYHIIRGMILTTPGRTATPAQPLTGSYPSLTAYQSFPALLSGGVLTMFIYISMILETHKTGGGGSGLGVLLMIFCALAVVETLAFLVVVAFVRR